MSNINLLQDKDVNCFIIYFYFVLFFYSLFLWSIWSFGHADIFKYFEILWQFDEVLYVYLVWPFFSLLNLSYITIRNNKIKLYFSISLIIFLSLISTYFILSIENIYRLNFPDQFLSLYINSIIFVIAILLTFILFARIIFKNSFNKHNFILLNSFFFLIILFIAMLFIVINKPRTPLVSDSYFSPFIFINLYVSFLFLFIPFVNFLFLFLIYFFKESLISYILIVIIALWDISFLCFGLLLSNPLLILEIFSLSIVMNVMYNFLFLIIWFLLYFYMKKSYSPIRMIVLFNIVIMLLYLGFFPGIFAIEIREPRPGIPIPLYDLGPVYYLLVSIEGIILFLTFVNLAIYLRARLTLKTLK